MPPGTTTPVWTSTGPSVPPISIGSQTIEGPRRTIIPQEVRNAEPLDASIHIIPSKHRDPTQSWSKIIGGKLANKSSADVYARFQMNLASDTALYESKNSIDFGLSHVDTTDEIGSVFAPTTRIGSATHGSDWIPRSHCISEATVDRVSAVKSKNHYNFKSEFETRKNKVVNQDFGRQNDHMSQPPLESTPIGTNTTNGSTSPSDSIPAGKKSPNPTPLTVPTESPSLPTYLPGDPYPDPSLPDSSKKCNLLNDTNLSKSKKKKRDKKKKHRKDKKFDLSDPSSINDPDSSYDSD